MGRNVGSVDKTIRLVAGIALLALAFLGLGGLSTCLLYTSPSPRDS